MKSNPDQLLQILIVEDNRTQAEYLRHLLENNGPDIPDGKGMDFFPVNECCNTLPHLYHIREMLSIICLGIQEAGVAGQRARYEIICPEGTLRFVSDTSSP